MQPVNVSDTQKMKRAGFLLITRLVLVAGFSALAWLILTAATGRDADFPPGIMLSGLVMFPVNIICLMLTSRFMKQEGQSFQELLAPRKGKLLCDIGLGLLWQVVLFIPFILAIMLTAWALFGDGMFQAFETIFYNPDSEAAMSPVVMLFLGIVTVFTFAPINAPVEELVYRGYAQSSLAKKWPVTVSILATSVAFGLQHIFYATTVASAIIYFAAFTAWGAVSGIIMHRQKRLFPVMVAHFLVNLLTSLPALVFPILILAGVVKL